MKFRNLSPNVLYVLRNEYRRKNSDATVNTQKLYDEFSDIPAKDIENSLHALQRRGLLQIMPQGNQVSLTRSGLSKKSIAALLDKENPS
jgi:RIO-like serine/threonine protein kinase